MKKDVIYVDNDDEIASITDKINSSKETLVALVLPKRCTVLQSSVNMKILQRITSDAGKNVVLITSESSLLPLAGVAGLYVAKTLQSKPLVPPAPDAEERIDTINEADDNPDLDPNKPIGELAGVAAGTAAVAAVVDDDNNKPIELGDEPSETDKKATDKKSKKEKKDKKLAVPNFNKFRTRMFLAIGGVILLIVLWYVGFVVMPRAKVEVVTENRSMPVTLSVTANPTISSVDEASNAVPAEVKTSEQTVTKKFTATGEKDNGTKASGNVVFYNCNKDDKLGDIVRTVPAGTGISSSGYTFITQTEVSVQPSGFNGNSCKYDKPSASVAVIAQGAGDKYNLSKRDYSVSGFSAMTASDTQGMGGGVSKIVKIVSQSDCDAAKNEASSTKIDDYKNQLAAQMQAAGLTPIKETFTSNTGSASCSPAVGQEANEATASVQLKMSMLGVNTAGLDQLIKVEATKQIEGSQSVIDTGSKTAIFAVKETKNNGLVVLNVTADTQVGIKQDANYISMSVAGKKRGQSVDIIKAQPGVSNAKINYSPFWVNKTPSNVKHITVKFTDNGTTK
ncbi:MAG: hypothetical protein WCP03_00600 [Candidatus Saccharibacteria bacterium]